ncbi:TPA: SRPBCC domain-containing protein [Enterobacter hormaechei]|uniref:SRPBCC domain-containing protein n=1 Tax=Enterobacteriaceae TaxID=543 RepID=UPI0005EE7052|nr:MULTISPECIES: SRPBCC domain-containing protein [Enterobacteriaceae]EIV8404018.1 SRPBCC domain-containing protein [Escherichia coli]HAS0757096.1 hypothetical protein [Enterobacter hormaechei subsp. xiangfangensis]EKS6332935.1 SRPBCC domain-containing protein [Enterobacter hormaechei]EKS6509315.1 SRPBCC domain-containing protein [Enterobacter hormaechei]EKT4031430.1 SRPBCC domain-containing protein [Enterobacter hormaechei]
MKTLLHAIKIKTDPERVWHALTDIAEMAAWHEGTVQGAIAVGKSLILNPKDDLRFVWETEQLVSPSLIAQICTEGPGRSVGKRLRFILSPLSDGRTLVELADGQWEDSDPHLPLCNTYWGAVLYRLKVYIEQH